MGKKVKAVKLKRGSWPYYSLLWSLYFFRLPFSFICVLKTKRQIQQLKKHLKIKILNCKLPPCQHAKDGNEEVKKNKILIRPKKKKILIRPKKKKKKKKK